VNCARVRSHLGDHLEGDLDLRSRTSVDEHLGRCASCARELSELRSTVGLLRSLPAPQPPAELTSEVMRRIDAGEGRARQSPAVIRGLFGPRVAAALAAGLAGFAIFTSVETSWVQSPGTVDVAKTEAVTADPIAIDMWKTSPPTLATTKIVQPRLAAIERTAAKRFYRPRFAAAGPRWTTRPRQAQSESIHPPSERNRRAGAALENGAARGSSEPSRGRAGRRASPASHLPPFGE